MDPLLEKNFITTKDASEISGYTADYLARLARSGKIIGKRIGHTWFIEQASLDGFLGAQRDRKIDRARELARARAEEYRSHRGLLYKTRKVLPGPESFLEQLPALRLTAETVVTRLLALSAAVSVVVLGALGARAEVLPRFGAAASEIAFDAAEGFADTFGTIPARVASRIVEASRVFDENTSRVSARIARGTDAAAPAFLATPDLAPLRMALDDTPAASRAPRTFANAPMRADAPLVTADTLRQTVSSAASLVASPTAAVDALARAYASVGILGYGAIRDSLDAYDALVRASGDRALALGVGARDALASAPRFVDSANRAFVGAFAYAAHAAIRADVSLAYGLADAAPKTARATVAFIGGAGDTLIGATANAPRLAQEAFLEATAFPAKAGPALASAIFGAEYAAADRFVGATQAVTGRYLAFVERTGESASAAASLGSHAAERAGRLAQVIPHAVQDAYLGALGQSALALSHPVKSVLDTPQVAAALAAAANGLSVGERTALATYEALHGAFTSAKSALAYLFGPAPRNLAVEPPVPAAPAEVPASSAPTAPRQTVAVNSYPSYTTVIQGISQATLNQSLSALRTDLLAQMGTAIAPVAAQTIQNITTIQQVNRIQDLSELIVRNGDFRGGTFDNGRITNGVSIQSASGSFDSLTAGSASISGALTVGGAGGISSTGVVSGTYLVASSSTATSTFAGSVAIDTNGFVYASSTRNVGIGTTSPWGLLSVNPDGILGPAFVIGSSTATNLIVTNAGRLGLGTTTPDALVSLYQTANGLPVISAYRNTDVAPTGDFINYRTNSGTTLFRVDNSGNLLAGGIINTGSQTITSTSTPQFRVQYDSSNEITTTVSSVGSTTIALNGSSPSLSFTPQSNAVNMFSFTNAAQTAVLSIDTLNRRIGIGTTTPAAALSVAGSGSALSQLVLEDTGASANARLFGIQTVGGAFNINSLTDALATTTRLTIDSSGRVGIGATAPAYNLDVTGNARFTSLVDAAYFTATSTTASQFPFASTTQVSALGSLAIGRTSTSTIAGDGSASTLYGPLTVRGTSAQAGSLTIQRGNAGGDNTLAFNDQTGSPLLKLYTSANTGYAYLNGYQSYLSLGMNTGGERLRIDTTGTIMLTANLVPSANAVYDLGSTADYWHNGYIDNVVANNLASASTSIAGTNTSSFSIDSNNPTTDTEDISLVFYRGAGAASNGVLKWNATTKRFEFNQNVLISNAATSPASTTLVVQGVASQTGALTNWLDSSSNTLATLTAAGRFGLGTSTPAVAFDVYATDAIRVPVGTTAQRPGTGDVGYIRYNTTTNQFEGYGTSAVWQGLGGVINAAQTSYITADSSDIIHMVTNSVERATITAAGNFGIGSTTPWGLLSVNPNGISGPSFVIGSSTATNFVVTNAGKVGIGTASPQTNLHIEASGAADILLKDTAQGGNLKSYLIRNSGANLYIGREDDAFTSATTYLTVENGGEIGIGTTTPAVALDIYATSAIRVPVGTTAQRPGTGDVGYIRYNTTTNQFEGYGTSAVWQGLGGVINAAQTSYITADSSDIIHMVTNSVERATITAAGNFGIGSTTPWGMLSVNPNGISGPSFVIGSSTQTNFIITNGGNVGIGTTTPGYTLSVAGTIYTTTGFRFPDGSVQTAAAASGNSALAGQVTYYAVDGATVSGTSTLFVAPSQKVGIGTTTPSALLHVSGTNAASVEAIIQDNQTTSASGPSLSLVKTRNYISAQNNDYAGDLNFQFYNTAAARTTAARIQAFTSEVTAAGEKGLLTFATMNVGTLTEAMRITDLGKVGVGSTTPWGLLSVNPSGITGPAFVVGSSTATNFIITNAGNVGIGTTTSVAPLTILTPPSATDRTGLDLNFGSSVNRALLFGIDAAVTGNVYLQSATHAETTYTGTTLSLNPKGGNVGIGTTTPSVALTVAQSSASSFIRTDAASAAYYAGYQVTVSSAAKWFMGMDGTYNDLYFTYGGNTRAASSILINSSGNVGIGTTAPGAKLEVNGSIKITSGSGGSLIFADGTTLSSNSVTGSAGLTSWGDLNFQTGGAIAFQTGNGTATSSKMVVTNSGFVGIGTASPSSKLDIADGGIRFSGTSPVFGAGDDAGFYGSGGLSGYLQFVVAGTGAMRINSTGAVGIGTTTPAGLAVGGGTFLSVDSSGGGGLALHYTNATAYGELSFYKGSNGSYIDSAGAATLAHQDIIFRTGRTASSYTVTEAVRIQASSGNLGVGTSSPFAQLSVNPNGISGPAFVIGSSTATNFIVTNAGNVGVGTAVNQNHSGNTSLFNVVTTAIGSRGSAFDYFANDAYGPYLNLAKSRGATVGTITYPQTGDTLGSLFFSGASESSARFNNGASVEAVVNATWTNASQDTDLLFSTYGSGAISERMRITSAGNVGIGTTTPGYLLHVYGAVPRIAIEATGADKWQLAANSDSTFGIYSSTASAYRVLIGSQGNVGIGSTTPWGLLSVNPNGITGPSFVIGSSTATNFIVTNAGNVGVGTSNPGAPLEVGGSGLMLLNGSTANELRTGGTSDLNLTAGNSGNGNIRFYGNSRATEYMRITSAGNVGIGTTTPDTTLTVRASGANGINLDSDSSSPTLSARLFFSNSTAGQGFAMRNSGGTLIISSGATAGASSGTSKVILDSSGNMVLGTHTAAARLDVQGAQNAWAGAIRGDTTSGQSYGLRIQAGTTSGDYAFLVRDATNVSEYFNVLGNGNVGIGIASPTSELHIQDNNADGLATIRLANSGRTFNIQTRSDITNNGFAIADDTAGAYRFVIDGSGNVGIGTTTPNQKLNVAVDSGANIRISEATNARYRSDWFTDNANGVTMNSYDDTGAVYLPFAIDASKTYLGTRGNVGIGTTNPTSLLEVNGDIRITSGSGGRLYFADGTSMNTASAAGTGTTSWSDLNFQTGGAINFQTGNGTATSTKVTITNGGKIGIGSGMTSPTALVEISAGDVSTKGALASSALNLYNPTTVGSLSQLSFGITGYGSAVNSAAYISYISTSANAYGMGDLIFGTRSVTTDTAPSERMRVTTDGNVGIGTTTPIGKIHLELNASNYLYIDDTSHNTRAVVAATSNGAQIYARDLSNNAAALIFTGASEYGRFSSSGNFGIGSTTPWGLLSVNPSGITGPSFVVGSSTGTQFVVTNAGNVGIGTSVPGAALDVRGDMRLDSSGTTDRTLYFRNQNAVATIQSDQALALGAGNGANSPTEYMRIAEGGNVGVGTTSPAYKVDVEGVVRVADATNPYVRLDNRSGGAYLMQIPAVAPTSLYLGYNGASSMVLTSSGNVGIGTTSPAVPLHVYATTPWLELDRSSGTSNTNIMLAQANVAKAYVGISGQNDGLIIGDASGDLGLRSVNQKINFSTDNGSTIAMSISSSNVGVGTTTPWGKLSVNPNGITGPAFVVGSSTATNFVVTNAGNVGIGTASPGVILDIQAATARPKITSTTGTNAAFWQFVNSGGSSYLGNNDSVGSGLLGTGGLAYSFAIVAPPSDSYAMQFATGANNYPRMTISGTGNVGIGTTTPPYKLAVTGGGSSQEETLSLWNGVQGMKIGFHPNNGAQTAAILADSNSSNAMLAFSTDGTERMRINYGGKVGIGTTTPNAVLTLRASGADGINLDSDAANAAVSARLFFSTGTAGQAYSVRNSAGTLTFSSGATPGSSSGTNKMTLNSSGDLDVVGTINAAAMTINGVAVGTGATQWSNTGSDIYYSGGKVGIGTSAPAVDLHVKNASALATVQVDSGAAGGGTALIYGGAGNSNIEFDDNSTSGTSRAVSIGANIPGGSLSTNSANMYFSTYTSGTWTGRMTLTNAGNFGIGTTTPAAKLAVYTTTSPAAQFTSTDNSDTVYVHNTGTYGGVIAFQQGSSGNSGTNIGYVGSIRAIEASGTGDNGVGLYSRNRMSFYINGTTPKMSIDTSGNVGIGTTTPGSQLSITGANASRDLVSFDVTSPGDIAKFSYDASASPYPFTLALGASRPFAITGGNVGIGTSTPENKLDVYGTGTTVAAIYGGQSSGFPLLQLVDQEAGGSNWNIENGRVADGTLSFYGNSAVRFAIDSSGYVGVASSTPYGLLSVNPDGITGPAFVIGSSTATNFIVTNAGNVGIGTTSPTTRLYVANTSGNAVLGLDGSSQSFITFKQNSTAKWQIGTDVIDGSGSNNLQFWSAAAGGVMSMTAATGYVGIGTTSPRTFLHLSGANVSNRGQLTIEGSDYSQITFYKDTTNKTFAMYQTQSSGDMAFANSVSGANTLMLLTGSGSFDVQGTNGNVAIINGAAPASSLTVNSNGYVGMGIASAYKALEVHAGTNQNILVRPASEAVTSATGIAIQGYNDAHNATVPLSLAGSTVTLSASGAADVVVSSAGNVAIAGTGTTTIAGFLDVNGTGANATSTFASNLWVKGGLQIGTGSLHLTGSSIFSTDGTLKLTSTGYASSTQLTTSGATYLATTGGNVGIGTTTPGTKLDVHLGSSDGYVFTGNRLAGANVGLYVDTNAGYLGTKNNYPLEFFTNSGAAQMTLLTSGNVGIGITSPSSKLEVSQNYTTAYAADLGASAATYNTGEQIHAWNESDTGTVSGLSLTTRTTGQSRWDILNVWTNTYTGDLVFRGRNGGTSNFEAMRITSSGYVGIGTTTPAAKLAVNGDAVFGNIAGMSYGGQTLGIQASSNIPALYAGGGGTTGQSKGIRVLAGTNSSDYALNVADYNSNPILYARGDGNVGIGTTTPLNKLTVYGSGASGAPASSGTTPTGYAVIGSSFNNNLYMGSMGTSPYAFWMQAQDSTNLATTYALALNPNGGNVGIGTNSPQARLNVVPGNATEGLRVSGSSNTLGISLAYTDAGTTHAYVSNLYAGNAASDIQFQFGSTLGSGTVMTLLQSGKVGIGDTAPESPLTVVSTSNIGLITLRNTTGAGGQSGIKFSSNATSGRSKGAFYFVETNGGAHYTGDFVWALNSSAGSSAEVATTDEKMRLTSGGNLGIGTTSPQATLHVQSGGGGRIVYTDSPTHYSWLTGQNYNLNNAFEITPSTAVGGFTFSTPALLVQNTGNVSIGTTVTTSAKLEVSGSGGTTLLVNNNTSGSAQICLDANGSDCSGTDYALFYQDSSLNTYLTNSYTTGSLNLGTQGNARLILSSAGSLRLATYGAGTLTTDASGNVTASSDERLKNIDGDFSRGLTAIRGLAPKLYHWTATSTLDTTTQYAGFIAQNVQAYIPEAVGQTPDGYLTLSDRPIIAAAVNALQELDSRTSWMQVASSTATSSVVMTLDASTGMVGIGTNTPTHTLTVAGDVAAISFVNTSTRTMKTDIAYEDASSTADMLGKLMEMKVATYRYTIEDQNDPLRLGLIAEDVQAVAPEVLSPDQKGVDIYKLATFTLAGVQALSAKVAAQETRLTTLEDRVAALESGAVSSASGTISFSTSTLASALKGFGILVEKGIAQFNTLVFRQLVASKDADGTSSAGSVTILAGNTVAQVNNSLVTPTTKVFVTFNTQVNGSWWVSDKQAGSFRVVLSAAQTTDVSFDYFLVQTEGQLATPNGDGTYQGVSVSQSSGPDTVAPVITVLGDNPIHVAVGGAFTDPGVTVTDDVDGTDAITTYVNGIQEADVASAINTSSQETYIITYRAMDKAGNISTAQRAVVVGNPDGVAADTSSTTGGSNTSTTTPSSADATAPVVTLTGAAAMGLTVGDTFADPGATASDETDGDLTAKIKVTGTVNTATAGLYTLTYSATDAAGNIGSVSRAVSVVAQTATASSTATSTTP